MSVVYWIWLQSVLGYGSRRLHTVLEAFSDAQTLYRQRCTAQMRALRLPVQVVQRLTDPACFNAAAEAVETCNVRGVQIIPYNSPDYPSRLRDLENPPAVLYATGTLPAFSSACGVAMVGTRRATDYGNRAAFSLAYRLARAGCLPVSGMAGGIDHSVHFGARAAEAPTVAFLPCGHGQSYLKKKQPLLEAVLAGGGCLLSELPPGAAMPRNAFQLRNRLIAGVAEAVVVIQAPEHSGALITAGYALQQGKELFVVPGLPGDASFAGAHALIRDGATPVFHARDVLEALPPVFALDMARAFAKDVDLSSAYRRAYAHSEKLTPAGHKTAPAAQNEKRNASPEKPAAPAELSATAAAVYRVFSPAGEYVDTLVEKTGLGSGSVLSAITELEIYGLIRSAAGGKYNLP